MHVLFDEGLADPRPLAAHLAGLETIRALAGEISPEDVAARAGSRRRTIRRMARELAAAPSAAVYGRIGTTTQRFGTTASWLVDVLNVLTGNLDRPGGAMFPRPPPGRRTRPASRGAGAARASGAGTAGCAGWARSSASCRSRCLAEEIETPGEGQVRALLTVAGNPAVSTPNSDRLAAALEKLDFMVSVDIYVNETTRHADVILPALAAAALALRPRAARFAVRNVANYSPPVLAPDGDARRVGDAAAPDRRGHRPGPRRRRRRDRRLRRARRPCARPTRTPRARRDPEELLAELAPRVGPERLLDLLLRSGPYGLTLADLEAAPHGSTSARSSRASPRCCARRAGKIELAPERSSPTSRACTRRWPSRSTAAWSSSAAATCAPTTRGCTTCRCSSGAAALHRPRPPRRRRAPRAGRRRAGARALAPGVVVPVEVTDDVMPGVVSIPHGWGHDQPGAELGVAAEHAGTNSNVLTDELVLEPLSGTAILNGIPVELEPV